MRTKKRTYEETHPWITFKADFGAAPLELWAMLGECQSKCEHLAGMPLRPDVAERMNRVYLAKGVHSTTAIEGNTLSEEDVLARIEGKLELPPSQNYLKNEIDNIIRACNQIVSVVCTMEAVPPISAAEIKKYNRQVLKDLAIADGGIAGELSPHMVVVGRYRGAPREDCDFLLNRLSEWLEADWTNGRAELVMYMAIVKAVLAHLYLAWIHYFADGNGRTARLVEYRILLASRVPKPAAHLLSNHYNATRAEYYRQLDAASRSRSIVNFVVYAVQGFRDGLREQIKHIRQQQLDVIWRNYVYDVFRDRSSSADKRRLRLVLDLSKLGKSVPRKMLTSISPKVAQLYSGRTGKTLTRDIKELTKLGLISWIPPSPAGTAGFKANTEVILGFLPLRTGDLKVD